MQEKFLKEVIGIVVGKQEEDIVGLLNSKKHVNEFNIAKKLDITINQTRNILYKISDYGLVSSERKKDKKKGWYTYFWKLDVLKSLEFLKEQTLKQLEQIKNQIKSRETKKFYVCERCNIEVNEETALLYEFTCNECGDVFSLKDNEKLLREFNMNLKRLESKIEFLNSEIRKEREKVEKIKEKEFKKTVSSRTKSVASSPKNRKQKKATKKKGIKKVLKKKPVKKTTRKKIAKKKPKAPKRVLVSSLKNRKQKKVIKKKPFKNKKDKKVVKKKSSKEKITKKR